MSPFGSLPTGTFLGKRFSSPSLCFRLIAFPYAAYLRTPLSKELTFLLHVLCYNDNIGTHGFRQEKGRWRRCLRSPCHLINIIRKGAYLLNILYLRYALEVERTGSITQAADNLYTTQPNLSKAVKKLETDMGMSIFKRTSKGLAPTKRGAQFLEQARSILDQLDELEALYHPSGAARIFFSVSIPRASYIAYSFTKFVHSLGGGELDIDFKETNSLETIGSVAEHEYKLGLIRYPLDQEEYFLRLLHERDLQHHLLWEYEPLLLFSREHPLTRQESIYEADLASSTLLEHGDLLTPAARTAPREAASPAARRIFLYERGSQFDLLHSLPNAYIWVSPIPDDMLHRHHLVQRRCHRPPHPTRDMIIYPKGYVFTELDRAFIAKLTGTVHELSEREYG